MNIPRRSTDLSIVDLDCLIRLCETRLHTINLHLKRNTFTSQTETIKTAAQIETTLNKLRVYKDRINSNNCDGA